MTTAIVAFLLLASISGGIPLLIYFEGLRLTRASTAGYFEMMQTLAAVCITWGFFHAALYWHQVIAGIVLMAAVAMVQRAQAAVNPRSSFPDSRISILDVPLHRSNSSTNHLDIPVLKCH